jgi:hypothetical protein
MQFSVPIIATQAGIIVGSTVFTIVTKTGQATTFVLKHGTNLAALAVGAGIEAWGDPLTALVTRQTIAHAGEAWITPAAETTSRSAALAAAAVSGVATTLIMTIAIVGGKAIIQKIKERGPAPQEIPKYMTYELVETDEDFLEIIAPCESLALTQDESESGPRNADSCGELELPLRSSHHSEHAGLAPLQQ